MIILPPRRLKISEIYTDDDSISYMPAMIDRIGRSLEWLVRANLIGTPEARKEAEKYLQVLPLSHRKRVVVGCERIVEKIRSIIGEKKIKDVSVVGEVNKTADTCDFDLDIILEDGKKESFSLKIQKSARGVNVRNPTLNSICESFTGKSFDEFLSDEQKEKYKKLGELYVKKLIKSKVVGAWAAEIFSKILNDVLKENPQRILQAALKEIRYKTRLLGAVVDDKGEFKGFITKFPDSFEKWIRQPESVKITHKGITVCFSLEGVDLFHIDIYMMSGSKGYRGKKLRCAVRVNFEINEKI